MSTLSNHDSCSNRNLPHPEDDYIARPGGHSDESGLFEEDHDLHRRMLTGSKPQIDLGDDAVNAEAAEARLRLAFPLQQRITLVRAQVRTISTTSGTEFVVRWRVCLADTRSGKGDSLEEAIDTLLARATPSDAGTAKRHA